MSHEWNDFFKVINNIGHEEGECDYFLISLSKHFPHFLDDVPLLTDGPIKFLRPKAKQTDHTEVFFRHSNSSPI